MIVQTQTLSVICPCHDEAPGIRAFFTELAASLDAEPDLHWRAVFVDDGSTDGTLEILHELAAADDRVMIYALSRNFGHQVALSAGLDVARADAVVMLDSDLQHPPSLIPEMIAQWRAGYDVVSAVRQNTRQATALKRWTSNAFYTVFNLLSDVKIVPGVADFTLLSRRAHEALLRMPERHRFLRAMISWTGLRRAEVPFVAPARAAGTSSYTPRRMVGLALDAVFSFSARPIRLATKLGLVVAAGGFGYLLYVIGLPLFTNEVVQGWSSVLSSVLILGGLQLVFIGLIGEYLARVFEEAKRRPLYLFKERPEATRELAAFFPEHARELEPHRATQDATRTPA